jgi:DNA-binding transcriptional LysR family regulator
MELRQLRHFLAIVDAGSVSRAAAELGKTQQALSKSLMALEESVGVRLLDRGAGKVTPTAFGRLLLPYARNIDAEARGFTDAVAALLGASQGRVRIGSSPTAASHLVSDAVLRLVTARPELSVAVLTGLYQDLRERLLAGELDLFVCIDNDGGADLGLEREVLGYETFGVVAGGLHPLARQKGATVAELREYPWVVGTNLGEITTAWQRGFEQAGLGLPRVAVETSSIEFARSAMMSSPCLSFLPITLFESDIERGELVVLEVEGFAWSRPIALYCRRSGTLSAGASAVVDALHRAAGRR